MSKENDPNGMIICAAALAVCAALWAGNLYIGIDNWSQTLMALGTGCSMTALVMLGTGNKPPEWMLPPKPIDDSRDSDASRPADKGGSEHHL